jgi:hypothetical protein
LRHTLSPLDNNETGLFPNPIVRKIPENYSDHNAGMKGRNMSLGTYYDYLYPIIQNVIETQKTEGGPIFANWQTLGSMDIPPISKLLHLTNQNESKAYEERQHIAQTQDDYK